MKIRRISTKEGECCPLLPILHWTSLAICLLGLTIWAIWVWAGLNISPNIIIDSNTPYLLSAIAQSLAAVLALVFTISLIASQLSSRFSHRILSEFFDWFTIAYICLFIIAVILPLWLLAKSSLVGVKGSLLLTVVCLILLPLYLLRFREILRPEHMLSNLKTRAIKQLLKNPYVPPENIIIIDNAVMSAFALKDYETFRKGVQVISDLASEAQKWEPWDAMPDATSDIYDRLHDIFMLTIEDPRAPIHVLTALRNSGMNAINNDLKEATETMLARTGSMGFAAVKKPQANIVQEVLISFDLVGNEAIRKGWEDVVEGLVDFYLSNIAKEAVNRRVYHALSDAIAVLGHFGFMSANRGWTKIAESAASTLGYVGATAGQTREKRMMDEAARAVFWLARVGASAILKKDIFLNNKVIAELNTVRDAAGVDTINSAFSTAQGFFSSSQKDRAVGKALDKFIISYKQVSS